MVLPGSAEDNTPPVLDEQTPLLVHGSAEAISRTPEAELRPSKSSDEESSSQEPEVLKGRKDLKSTTGILGIILVLLLG